MKNKPFNVFIKFYRFILKKYSKSIRLEIMAVFVICVFTSLAVGKITDYFIQVHNGDPEINRSRILERLNAPAKDLAENIEQKKISINDKNQIGEILSDLKNNQGSTVIISNVNGRILYSSDNTLEAQLDINTIIKDLISSSIEGKRNFKDIKNKGEYMSFYPVKFIDEEGYIIISNKINGNFIFGNDSELDRGLILSIVVFLTFISTFIFLTNKRMKYIEYMSAGLLEISKGNLHYKIKRQGEDELALLVDNINFMAQELEAQIENERNAEKTKNELITNVSHDLRTPLTSIKGYLEIIKSKKGYDKREIEQYINIVYDKSEKLEMLINDLFEYTKLVNNAISVEKQCIDLKELLDQLIEEFVPICEESNVTMTRDFINENVIVNLDPNKTVRIFENLLINAVRYSLKPGDINICLKKQDEHALVSIRNKCETIDKVDLERIFERFYRIEKSRNSNEGGSGLGLAIAKSMVEVQGGTIEAKYEDNYISFTIKF